MQGIKRRVVFIALYEAIAIAMVTLGLALFSDQSVGSAGMLSVIVSAIAIGWNLAYNAMFEAWEARQVTRGRSVLKRVVHAVGFEAGLVVMLVPFFAWWLAVSLWQALALELGFITFFLVYSFAFSWAFDRVFGLPLSAVAVRPQSV